jgi:hypothetical protein
MAEHEFKFDLGKRAKDKISGFTGIITSRIEYLTGCDQYGLKAPIKADGEPIDVHYFDEGRIVILDDGAPAFAKEDVSTEEDPGADTHPDAPTSGK